MTQNPTLAAALEKAEAQRNLLSAYPVDSAEHDGYTNALSLRLSYGEQAAADTLTQFTADLGNNSNALTAAWIRGYKNGLGVKRA